MYLGIGNIDESIRRTFRYPQWNILVQNMISKNMEASQILICEITQG